MDTDKTSQTLLEVTDRYQNIRYKDIVVPVPYFINTAEQVYKQAMKEAGIDEETVNKVVRLIKEGKTPLGSTGGKGSPEEITSDLARLMDHLAELNYSPIKSIHVRSWMVEMHIGLDCAGYVYNILSAVEKNQNIKLLNQLAWKNPEVMKRSHAGAFIFDSENLEKVEDCHSLRPLDLLIEDDHTHVGIVALYQGSLTVSDCSMGRNGISFFKISQDAGKVVVENNDYWTNLFNTRSLVIRRFSS